MKFKNQLVFWSATLIILTLLFSNSLGSVLLSLFFVTFLFPVVFGTSLFFNQYLVPKYLLPGKGYLFILYLIYMLVISIWLELLVMVLAFVILADYQFENLGNVAGDIYVLTIILYLIVFINGFIEIFIGFRIKDQKLSEVERLKSLEKQGFIVLKVNRKNVRVQLDDIFYLESLSDYVQVYTINEVLITKEKISVLEQTLPDFFIRIHRSFLVNLKKITFFSKEEVTINNQKLPIGRKYKKEAIHYLELDITDDKTTLH